MPSCGSQCILCDLPVRYDTYKGCSHACKYCFAKRNSDIEKIENGESVASLINFVKGKRTCETNWCDWNIPLHFGGLSDPFQPYEKTGKRTYEALKVLAESKYPVVISTKGKLCIEEPYLSLLSECNVVMQISMACSEYDKLEEGAPSFEKRMEMLEKLAKSVKRVNVRVQPYMHECFKQIRQNIKSFADAGAYGVIFEGMKFVKKKPGLVRVGADFTYPTELLTRDFSILKDECHKHGLKFYSGENRLRQLGDSLTCCGIDGLEGFVPNCLNANHILNGDKVTPSPAQQVVGTATAFRTLHQTTAAGRKLKKQSFQEALNDELVSNKKYVYTIMGKEMH